MTDRLAHAADLPLLALGEDDLEPAASLAELAGIHQRRGGVAIL